MRIAVVAAGVCVIAGLLPPLTSVAQRSTAVPSTPQSSKGRSEQPSSTAYIVDCYIAAPREGSSYETGAIHIVYSDGRHFVEDSPPKKESTPEHVVLNAMGFSNAQLADDRQALGWTVQVDNCGTSYTIPLSLTIFRSGKVIQTIEPGPMIWGWMFRPGGHQVVVASGPIHGSMSGRVGLFDVKLGKRLAEVSGDEESGNATTRGPTMGKRLRGQQEHGHGLQGASSPVRGAVT